MTTRSGAQAVTAFMSCYDILQSAAASLWFDSGNSVVRKSGLSIDGSAPTMEGLDTIEGDMRAYPNRCQVVELGADRFVLRPIRPDDRRQHADFIARIDIEHLRRRFCDPSGPSPEADFERHVRSDAIGDAGFVAERETSGGTGEIVGEVRLYRYPGAAATELAIMVRSDMQRRGLGRALMRTTVEYCAAHGLEMIARILPDNEAMIRLAERSGMQVEHGPGGTLAIAHLPPARCRKVRSEIAETPEPLA